MASVPQYRTSFPWDRFNAVPAGAIDEDFDPRAESFEDVFRQIRQSGTIRPLDID